MGRKKRTSLLLAFLLSASALVFSSRASAQGFIYQDMTMGRVHHTETVLNNGLVLIAGGYGVNNCNGGAVASAEIYDPTAGTFSAIGNMTVPRAYHTATLLQDGRVLIAGGLSSGDCGTPVTATAEIFDPATFTFSATGSMVCDTYGATDTLLPDGTVLIAGGDASGPNTCAEIYNPATGQFTATATSMTSARGGHTATLLMDGTVLLAGGMDGNWNILTTAEIYNPSTGAFSPTSSMNTARFSHTATLLTSGSVLIAGGETLVLGYIFQAVASAEIYTPASMSFALTGDMTSPRASHTATLLSSGKTLVAGGYNATFDLVSSAELYDPLSASFSATTSPNVSRLFARAAVLSTGLALITGGSYNSPSNLPFAYYPVATVDSYDPNTATFQLRPNYLLTARKLHSATLLSSGQVLVVGGADIYGHALNTAELYNSATAFFSATPNTLTTARQSHTATLLPNGQVLLAGGQSSAGTSPLASAELYDPTTGAFTSTGAMSTARVGHTATLLNNGQVLIAGGMDPTGPTYFSTAELYDPATGSFTSTGSMLNAHALHTATLLNDGTVLIAGGQPALNTAEIYNPATGMFTAVGNLNLGRFSFTATLLHDGTVLIAGAASAAEIYSPASETFITVQGLAEVDGELSATLLPDSTVLLAGGGAPEYAPSVATLSSAQLYIPATQLFLTLQDMSELRQSHTATLLTNGEVLIVGGSSLITLSNGVPLEQEQAMLTGQVYQSVSANVTATPNPLSFGNQIVGTSATLPVTLTNSSSNAIMVFSVTISPSSAAYTETNNCGASLALRASCTISVTFAPVQAGAQTGLLSVFDSAFSSPQSVSLTGTAMTIIASLSVSGLNFGNQNLGSSSPGQPVVLSNGGTDTLTLTGISITGTNAGDFSQSNTCGTPPVSLAPNASCTITVTFTPTASGTRNAALSFADNAPDSPQMVSLAGTGVPMPLVTLSPTSVTFGGQAVDTTSPAQPVMLTNTGTSALTITAIGFTGTNSGDFGQTNACGAPPATLAVNASCTISVTFTPLMPGSESASLSITDNASGSPQAVTLTGVGQDFSLSPVQTMQSISPGQTASYTISVAPIGGFNQSVSFTCSGAPSESNCGVSPSMMTLNGATPVNVTVTVATMAPSVASPKLHFGRPTSIYAYWVLGIIAILFSLALLASINRHRARRAWLAYALAVVLLCWMGMMLSACSGGSSSANTGPSNPGTPMGNYTIVVTGSFTSGASKLTHTTNLTLTIN